MQTKNISIDAKMGEMNILNEGNHNSNGNPHSQYLQISNMRNSNGVGITANTSSSNNGKFTKIFSINITTAYGYFIGKLILTSGINTNSSLPYAECLIRVNAQTLGSPPVITCELLKSKIINNSYLCYYISKNDSTGVTIDFYTIVSGSYNSYFIFLDNISSIYSAYAILSNQSFVSDVSGKILFTDYVKKDITANQPSYPQISTMYFDTTLNSNGKPIWWNGNN